MTAEPRGDGWMEATSDEAERWLRASYPGIDTMEREELFAALLAEHTDVMNISGEVAKVYVHVSGGRISKPNTIAEQVIAEADEHYERTLAPDVPDAEGDDVEWSTYVPTIGGTTVAIGDRFTDVSTGAVFEYTWFGWCRLDQREVGDIVERLEVIHDELFALHEERKGYQHAEHIVNTSLLTASVTLRSVRNTLLGLRRDTTRKNDQNTDEGAQ